MKYSALFLICAIYSETSISATGIAGFTATTSELATLPGFCTPKARKNGNNKSIPDVRYWVNVLGNDNYMHIHHYCYSLLLTQHALQGYKNKKHLLSKANSDLQYSIDRSTEGFKLIPEMLVHKSFIYELMKKPEEAKKFALNALKVNKRYEKAYLNLSRIYLLNNEKDKAVEVVRIGIKNTDSNQLKARLKKIDTKL